MRKPEDVSQEAWDQTEGMPERFAIDIAAGQLWDIRHVVARAIMAAKAEEREACAQLIETDGPQRYYNMHGQNRGLSELEAHLAAAIRSRKEVSP